MLADDLTVAILQQIRDGVTSIGTRLDATNERLDGANHRLDRVEQGLLDLGQFMRQIALDQTRHEQFHTQHVDLLERDVGDLKNRVTKLEKRRGS